MSIMPDKTRTCEIEELAGRIHYYKKIVMSASCPKKRLYFENLMLQEVDRLTGLVMEMFKENNNDFQDKYRQERVFTLQELSNYDGTMGKPAYTAVNGVVYDVSNELSWGGGTHFGLVAGRDVSAEFNKCHTNQPVLLKLPRVGVIKA